MFTRQTWFTSGSISPLIRLASAPKIGACCPTLELITRSCTSRSSSKVMIGTTGPNCLD
jgi:hypothetical protein